MNDYNGTLTFRQLQTENAEWAEHNFPETVGEGLSYRSLLGVFEEAGELAHAHLKGEQGIRHTSQEIHAMKADAVGDILVYLAHYCHMNDLDRQADPMGAGDTSERLVEGV